MIVLEVAKKYASALFMSAKERSLLDQAYDQFTGLQELLEDDRSLLTFLSSPRVDERQKQELVRSVFDERMDRLFVEFLMLLVRKRRAIYLPEITDEFNRLVEFEKGINRVTVITAIPLIRSEEDNLMAGLVAKTGMKIEMEKKVDPSLAGGMVIIMADQIIDGSVQHGLNLLEEQLQKVKVH